MKNILALCLLLTSSIGFGQIDKRITSLDFVQVLGENFEEAIYYYQNNWKVLREWAVEEEYILSYDFIQTEPTEDQPFHFVLSTTYPDKDRFDAREENFQELIKRKGKLRLKSELQPVDFRKILFSKEKSMHGFAIY